MTTTPGSFPTKQMSPSQVVSAFFSSATYVPRSSASFSHRPAMVSASCGILSTLMGYCFTLHGFCPFSLYECSRVVIFFVRHGGFMDGRTDDFPATRSRASWIVIVPRAPARGRDRFAESRTAHAATRVHLRVCPPDLDSCNSVTSRVLFGFWAHSRAILPRAPRQENLLRREAPSVLGPPQAPKNLASETLGAFLHGKSGVPKDISRTTTSRTSTARNIPMPHPGAYVASDRETCVCAFKAFHASTFHSTA